MNFATAATPARNDYINATKFSNGFSRFHIENLTCSLCTASLHDTGITTGFFFRFEMFTLNSVDFSFYPVADLHFRLFCPFEVDDIYFLQPPDRQ